ncbi:hypothetical protein ABPG74_001854 [Tetrahymena malaccensis]
MIDPSLFDNLRAEITNLYGPLSDDQNPSHEWFDQLSQKNPQGDKNMRKKLFDLVVEIPHFQNLIQISKKMGKFEQLCKKMVLRKYTKGDILFRQQSFANELILVVEGQISMWQVKSDPDINNEQRLIQTAEKSLKAYKREEAKQSLDLMRNLEEDSIFRIVARRNAYKQHMQKSKRKLNNQHSMGPEMSHTNTFCYDKNELVSQNSINQHQQPQNQTCAAAVSQFAPQSSKANNQQISTFIENNSQISTLQAQLQQEIELQEIRYFKTENICKYKRIFYHQRGDFIGENEALSNEQMNYLAVAHTDRVLAFVISTDAYLSMFDLESSKTEFIVRSLQKQFPTARHESLLRIAYDFKTQSYDYNQPIFRLKDKADKIYIVKSGLVEVGQENLIKLALLGEGQLLGFEDCVSDEQNRNFWATSKSGETLLFYIPSSLFLEIVEKTYDGKLKKGLLDATNNKLNYYNQSTSKIQDIFSKAAPKKKHANNVDNPILSYMLHGQKTKSKQNNSFLDNAYKTMIVSKSRDQSQNRRDSICSNDEVVVPNNHSPIIITNKFKTMNNINTEDLSDEPNNNKSYFQLNKSHSPQLRCHTELKEHQKENNQTLQLPNINLNISANPQKRVQILVDYYEPQHNKTKINFDRLSERKVKSLANIPDYDEPMTERDRQLQNLEKSSNKTILKTIDKAIDFKMQILNKKPKPKPVEKEDAFMTAFKYQKARFHSVFTKKKPGLPFKCTQFERLQNNLKKFANENLICRQSEQNLQLDDEMEGNDQALKVPQSCIYYNNLDDSITAPSTLPVSSRKKNDRPSSLQHIDMDFDSQNNSINNINIKSLNKLSPLKVPKKMNKNVSFLQLNQTTSNKSNKYHTHSSSTPFIRNIFLNETCKINNPSQQNLHIPALPKLAPLNSNKKISENNNKTNNNNHNDSYLDQTTLSGIPLSKNLSVKKEVKILDFDGIFAPKQSIMPSSTRSNGLNSLGITLNTTYRSQLNDSANYSQSNSQHVSPVKTSSQKNNNILNLLKQSPQQQII